MSIIRSLIKTGVAAKLLAEARKPENQRKAKEMLAQAQQKRRGRHSGPPPQHGGRF